MTDANTSHLVPVSHSNGERWPGVGWVESWTLTDAQLEHARRAGWEPMNSVWTLLAEPDTDQEAAA